jgi:hypothetical protein
MNKLALSLAAVVAVSVVGIGTSPADAKGFGVHFSGPGYHFDIGHAQHHNSFYYGGHGNSGCGWGGGHQWHDTSHYDVVPGYNVWHGNHFDYVPPRVIYHQSGHVDHLHW